MLSSLALLSTEASSFVVEFAASLLSGDATTLDSATPAPEAEPEASADADENDLAMRLVVGELRPDWVLLRGIGCALMRANMARPLYVATLTRRYW